MQTSDSPTNPRTRRVIKNGQVNSGSFTPHTVSPMQHLQAGIVRNSKPFDFCFGEQESECRTDPPIVHIVNTLAS